MCTRKENMNQIEVMVRFYIAIFFIVLAVSYNEYLILVLPIIIIYTALKRRCFIYSVFGINKTLNYDRFYQSLLPIHNPSAVIIFDENGSILFHNKSSNLILEDVKSIKDITIPNYYNNYTNKDEDVLFDYIFENADQVYQINIKYLNEYKYTLAYFTDITQMRDLSDDLEKTQSEIIYVMGEIGETRSKETGYHVKRVALYSELLALKYGLSEKEADILKMASPMHDIGKVGIPDAILNKPGRHTKEEFEIMKTHSIVGYSLLNKSDKPIIKAAATVALHHHEKYDGSGYPNALVGDEIDIYGRITAIADVFDALGSHRIYKKAWPLDDILELFKKEKGKHFDPKLIDIFFDNLDEFLKIRDKFVDVE